MVNRSANMRAASACPVPTHGIAPRGLGQVGRQRTVGVDAEHQTVVVARQNGARTARFDEDAAHPLGLVAARQVEDVTKMQKGLVGMAVQRPLHQAAAEQRLFWRALRDLDVGVDSAVVIVHRETGRFVLLRITKGGDGRRQGCVAAAGIDVRRRQRRDTGTTGK